mgnify:CR=1 FL=1
MPHNGPGHVKEHLRKTICGQFGDLTKDDGVDQGGEERLDDEPERTQNGLLVARDEISPDEEDDQVAIVPDVAQLQIPPFFAWCDNEIPGIIFSCGLSLGHMV